MLFERVATWVFERSTDPVSRILACGVIGAIICLLVAFKQPDGHIEWWLASAGGAGVGMSAGGALALWDVKNDPARSRGVRRAAMLLALGIGFVLVVGITVVTSFLVDRR